MFGNILIDKLRISIKVTEGFDCNKAKSSIDLIMRKHFRENNYKVSPSKTYFRVTFTPTLYLDTVEENDSKSIVNLEMISEEDLLELLMGIYKVLGDSAVITWIDLTKNTLIEESTNECIDAISKWKIKYPYRRHPVTSRVKNTTLTLSPLTRKNHVNCKNHNRKITFYPKIKELESKSNVRFLDNLWLSEEEIRQLLQNSYQKETGRLFLKDLKIVRCEQRYKFTKNIKRITQAITGSADGNELTLSLLIELLESGELYEKLNEFYTNELRRYIFYDNIYEDKEVKLNKQEGRIKNLVIKHNIDIADFQHLFSDIGYKEHFNRSAKKIYYHTKGEYYNELYEKFEI
ncbi:MAG: hypothetical protein NC200_01010 [Candidatus Gastranaerophilales bacterium]|nr:hypothetical protein [Candidatus Gastranaerophilales bacterium]